ncbi:MAG: Panacea domain-containing protein [Sumerlaeia bacterium]
MLEWSFNEKKATQLAARFLQAAGGPLSRIHLLKLMYLADRLAIGRYGSPITGDRPYSMRWGPVLSKVYDLMKVDEPLASGVGAYWLDHIENSQTMAILKSTPATTLSRADQRIVEEIVEKFGPVEDPFVLSDLTHTFPEWQDPGSSSRPISMRAILEVQGFDDEEIEELLSLQRTDGLISRVAEDPE